MEVLSVASCGGAVSSKLWRCCQWPVVDLVSGPLWISQYQVVEVLSVASCGGAVSGKLWRCCQWQVVEVLSTVVSGEHSSVQDGICALANVHNYVLHAVSEAFPKCCPASKLTVALSRPLKENSGVLPLSTSRLSLRLASLRLASLYVSPLYVSPLYASPLYLSPLYASPLYVSLLYAPPL